MSWTIHPEIVRLPASAARVVVNQMQYVPQQIKDYILLGIDGLVAIHGEEVLVTVKGYGHLCTGKDYDVTSATVSVEKSS